MTDLNEIHITGRLVRDTELRSTGKGVTFAWFQLAVNGRKDKEGNQQTDFIVCQVWGKSAEMLEKFGKKGTRIMITKGNLKTYSKEDRETGTRQNHMYVLINSYEFLDSLSKSNSSSSQSSFFDSMGEDVDF